MSDESSKRVISVKYLGSDTNYWIKLKDRFESTYPEMDFSFSECEITKTSSVREEFVKIYQENIEILFIDFSKFEDKCITLAKMVNRNNETRLISTVGLIGQTNSENLLNRMIAAALRIIHYKNAEIHDVVYDPISFLDVDLAFTPAFVRGEKLDGFEISQLVRVGYISRDHFHIETNSYLKIGDILDVDRHPLELFMKSKKVHVESFSDQDLYYNQRFSYDLEFIYVDNDYFSVTSDRWKEYKELKKDPEKLEGLDPMNKKEIIADMKSRKKKFLPIRSDIDDWVDKKQQVEVLKKLKILVVDRSCELLMQLDKKMEDFPYSLNFQTFLMGDFYHISRTLPHIIVYHVDEELNTEQALTDLLKKIQTIQDYFPYILVFSSEENTEKLRSKNQYDNILSYEHPIDLNTIELLASKLNAKLSISDELDKVFLKSSDPDSMMFIKREIKVLGMTESILYFRSVVEIPMWSVFKVTKPVEILLTIVPHKEEGDFSKEANCYRSIIHGTREGAKAELRQLINYSLMEEEEGEESS